MHPRLVCLTLLVLAAPLAAAGTAQQPDLTDPAGDVRVQGVAPAPWADAADVRAAWFHDDDEGLHATILVEDLAAIAVTDAGLLQDTMFFVLWQPSYAEPGPVASREGEWELRADYLPLSTPSWHFWMERPCRDGVDSDGCPGADRDIIDGLPGEVDLEASTVRITAPWEHLDGPQPGDGIHGLRASAQMVWPSYPAYAVDWDTDQASSTCHLFTSLPLASKETAEGATGSSHGREAPPEPAPGTDACEQAREAARAGGEGGEETGGGPGQAGGDGGTVEHGEGASGDASVGGRKDPAAAEAGPDQGVGRATPGPPAVLVFAAACLAAALRRQR